jgi:hypothetical protein
MSTRLNIFLAIVIGHWAEHLFQIYQIYVLGWPTHMAGGLLGYVFPWLVHSEVLHFGYAVLMMIGLVWLRGEMGGAAESAWKTSTIIQSWHLVEHTLLQIQALTHPFFGKAVPTSIVQLWFPRVELHLFYNTIVTIPMAVAVYRKLRECRESAAASRSDVGEIAVASQVPVRNS